MKVVESKVQVEGGVIVEGKVILIFGLKVVLTTKSLKGVNWNV